MRTGDFSRDILLDIIGRFLHLDSTNGKGALIFPRSHQIDAVLKMLAHARDGASVGDSARSVRPTDFRTAVVVTDRVVLDRQLQDTIAQFEVANGGVNSEPTQGLKWRATSCRNLRPSVSSR
ncbi:hypothetical protein MesoLjLc_37520 [Mesorhizobium sp. L-8-10]|uniref:hypothetical protein n=1 Tax=Mesorhizobium sp. L-8-10 TaxID=2744523 RepID=UPI001936509E|nr:hypothetical protein [Mesorhizobium sp. L-8-10]BCH31822.1 hypothetical protein MesoLjLc_37520 [Mesorhizobium sp. L-8-10]